MRIYNRRFPLKYILAAALALIGLCCLSCGAQVKKARPKPAAKAAKLECSEGEGMSNGSRTYGCNGGKWVDTTEETLAYFAKENRRRGELFFALRSRVLTDEEMGQVVELDWGILEPLALFGGPYGPDRETQLRRRFNEALLQQFKLRTAAGAKPAEATRR